MWYIPRRPSIAETRRDKLSDFETQLPTPVDESGKSSSNFEEQQEEDASPPLTGHC